MRFARVFKKVWEVLVEPKFRYPLNEPINIYFKSRVFKVLSAPYVLLVWASYLIPYLFKGQINVKMNERIVELPISYSFFENIGQDINVLEFGCNESRLALELASAGCSVTAVDLESYNLTHPNLSFKKGEFMNMDLPENYFDYVTAISALEHSGLSYYSGDVVDRADKKIIDKFYNLLKPGGHFILTVPVGVGAVFGQNYRSYDRSLFQLAAKFRLDKKAYFKSLEGGRYWINTSEDEAFSINNSMHAINAVGIFRFQKTLDL